MNILENEQEYLSGKIETSFRLAQETMARDKEDITLKGMKKFARAWLEAKRPLIELLGGQTRVEKIVESELELEDARKFVKTFMDKITKGQFTYKREDYAMQRLKFSNSDFIYDLNGILNSQEGVKALHINSVTDELIENYRFTRICSNVGIDPKRQKGAKFTKFFLTVFKAGMEKFNLLQDAEAIKELDIISQDFSQLINTMKTAKRRQTVVLSCDLEDYLTMSMGTSWDSCHQLGKMYGQGALAYALSPNVLISYVKAEDHEYKKKWRQVVYCDVNTGFAIGSRQYPSPNNVASDGARHLWQETYNMYKNGTTETTNFKFSKKSEGLKQYLKKSNSFAYVDILEFSPSSEKIQGHVWSTWVDGIEKPVINCCPREIICLKCGRPHEHHRNYEVTCGECPREGQLKCKECGRWHAEETSTYADAIDGFVCPSCLRSDYTYCPDCQRWERQYNMVNVHGRSICESCAFAQYERCDSCSEWHLSEESTRVHVRGRIQQLCQACVTSRQVTPCSHCGRLHIGSGLTMTHGGHAVCRGCLHRHYAACELCDGYHLRPNIHVVEHDDETMRACGGCRESRGMAGVPLGHEVAGESRGREVGGATGSDEDPASYRSPLDQWFDTLPF